MMRKISLLRPAALCVLGAVALLPGCRDRNGTGAGPQVLTTDDHNDQYLAYSPDGRRTAWWQQSEAGWDLMVGNADLGSAEKRASAKLSAGPVFWSPDNSTILFGSDSISYLDVWTVPADSGPAIRRTSLAGLEFPSSWVGRDFQYFSSRAGGELFAWQYAMTDSTPVRMVPSESSPHWAIPSPDGSRVAWNRFEGGQRTVWATDSAGTPRELTTEGFEQMAEGPWSPDGSEILYVSRRTGTDDIWVVPANGGAPRQLTRDVRNDREPAWSPDGRSVAFISDRGKQTDVWVVPAAGGEPTRVTDTPEEETRPAWRPGTTELAYEKTVEQAGLWSVSVEDGTEHRLTPDSVRTGWFNVSPDGSQIVYLVLHGGGNNDIWMIGRDGSGARAVLTGGANTDPRWSPDGKGIVFTSDRGGSLDVWTLDPASGQARALVSWPTDERDAQWSSDGKSIFFTSNRDAQLGALYRVSADGGDPVRMSPEGIVLGLATNTYTPEVYALTLGGEAGQFSAARLMPDGSLAPVLPGANALTSPIVRPGGDSLTLVVETGNGENTAMLLPARGGGKGRRLLEPGQFPGAWAPEGDRILFYTNGGISDLGVLNLKDGTSRVLTSTPEDEQGAEWTPDGKTVVFRREVSRHEIVKTTVKSEK